MDDLTVIKTCAEAMGWRAFKEKRGNFSACVAIAKGDRMPWERKQVQDLERYEEVPLEEAMRIGFFGRQLPNPLTDDAQAMALGENHPEEFESAVMEWASMIRCGESPDLKRILCLAVAQMWRDRK